MSREMIKPVFIVPAFVVAVVLLLGYLGESVNAALSYDRDGLQSGEVWRALSGHLVHTNLWHTAMNVSVLTIAIVLFYQSYSARLWAIFFVALCCLVSMSLYFFSPWVNNYVGLSGVLYGVLVLGLLKNVRQSPILYVAVLLYIVVKITWEQTPWYDVNIMRSKIDAAVIVDAHLYGLINGVIIFIIYILSPRIFHATPR